MKFINTILGTNIQKMDNHILKEIYNNVTFKLLHIHTVKTQFFLAQYIKAPNLGTQNNMKSHQ